MARFHSLFVAQLICAVALVPSGAFGAEADGVADLARARAEAAEAFKKQVSPFVKTYCGRCHTGCDQEGGVTFQSALNDADGPAFRLLWKRAAAQIAAHQMPPDEARKQPSAEDRKAVLDWI